EASFETNTRYSRYRPRGEGGVRGRGEIGGSGESAGSGAVRSGAMARLDGKVAPGRAISPAGDVGRDPAGVPGDVAPGTGGVAGCAGGPGMVGAIVLGKLPSAGGGVLGGVGGVIN